jgi:hypothetical protein
MPLPACDSLYTDSVNPSWTGLWVKELRRIAERELLLEEHHRYETEHLEGGEEADNHTNERGWGGGLRPCIHRGCCEDGQGKLFFHVQGCWFGCEWKCTWEWKTVHSQKKDASQGSGSSGAKFVDGDSGEDEEDNPSKRNMGVAHGATPHDQPEKRQRTIKTAIEDSSSDE